MPDQFESIIAWFDRTPNWWIALLASVAIFAILFVGWFGVQLVHRKLSAENPDRFISDVFEALSNTSLLFLLVVSLYVSFIHLALPENVKRAAHLVFTFAMVLQGASWAVISLTQISTTFVRKRAAKNAALPSALFLIKWALRTVIWSVAALVLLENIGVNVTALIATLGVGGIALGLAAQGLFKDLLGSLAIVLDRPFVIGDFITLGELSGTVEEIGMKTTRLRSQIGEEIIVPNADLLSGQIHNYRRMKERAVTFRLPLDITNSAEKITAAKEAVEAAVRHQETAEFIHCVFREFKDASLILEVAYKVRSRKVTDFLRVQDAINLEIKSAFSEREIQFAPTVQRIRLEGLSNDGLVKPV